MSARRRTGGQADRPAPGLATDMQTHAEAAAALLKDKPRPTDADIDTAMARNICRCATYNRIREGIHRAAAIAAAD